MKRSQPLVRRGWIRRVSAKARRRAQVQAIVRVAVFERDGYRCLLEDIPGVGRCFGELTPHHLVKRSAGGDDSLDNEVTLCSHHNTWVEDNPEHARELGLVASRHLRVIEQCRGPRAVAG